MNEVPRYCENCGEEPPNKRHYPLEARVKKIWTCKRCRDMAAREKKEAAKGN